MVATRITRLMRAVVGAQLTEIEADHADAILDQERQRLRQQVASYNRGLAGHAAICGQLRARIERLEATRDGLPERIEARLSEDDREGAGELAYRLQRSEDELARVREELSRAETTYRELLDARGGAVERARARIDRLQRSVDGLQMQRALAELGEMAADIGGGPAGATFERVQERVDARRQYAEGRARVARDTLQDSDPESDPALRRARTAAALQRYEEARADPARE